MDSVFFRRVEVATVRVPSQQFLRDAGTDAGHLVGSAGGAQVAAQF